MKRLRLLFLSSRPLSWINTAYPFAVPYFLITGTWDARATVGTLFFLIPYNLAMYGINDVFDYESDIHNPRKGGAEGAIIAPRDHRFLLWSSVLACLPFVVVLVSVGSLAANTVLAVSLGALVAYSWKGLRFKERPVLDSLTSATHFVSPAAYAMVLAGGHIDFPQAGILLSFFLWGMASHAFGAVQDIVADRAGGISSIATAFGAKGTVRFAVISYAAAGAALFVVPGTAPWVSPVALLYIAAIAPWWNCRDEDSTSAHRGWTRFLALNFIAGTVVTFAVIAYVLWR